MNDMPELLIKVLFQFAQRYTLRASRNTHYDAINMELSLFQENSRRRLNFELAHGKVHVFIYLENFPCFPRILSWCHENIELFPSFSSIEWRELEELPLDGTEGYYAEKIKVYIDRLLKT